MKIFIYCCFAVFALSSCSSDYIEPSYRADDSTIILSKYDEARNKTRQSIVEQLKFLGVKPSRASLDTLNGYDLIRYLLLLPESELDSLRQIYCTEENKRAHEIMVEFSIDKMIELSSPEEVQNLFSFRNDYIEMGGHNPGYLINSLNTTFSQSPDIIRDNVIEDAAIIDEYLPNPTEMQPAYVDTYAECLRQLTNEMIDSKEADIAILGLTDGVGLFFPEAGICIGLGGMVYSLFSTLEATHKFHECVATRTY